MRSPGIGLVVLSLGLMAAQAPKAPATSLSAPLEATIPGGPMGDAIRLGQMIFTNTPTYGSK